ncbi:helix-turn-helix domain-containing protein [Roseovarius mucosus]|uniref:helix-turn-helix domain-containing protein n=1 Tax=Roseovarius mucosus TaxID=215743 RepID=UPI001C5DD4FE|nr:helix-turn-helix domain-containing protein [Roseovarius mucosus]MBW4976195.1 helix-turn-helix domain-containing protein [Roseovarius mucosus]
MPLSNLKKTDLPRHLLTVKEVAELDNCSEKAVRRAIASGLLQAIRVGPGGRLLRIDPAAHAVYRQAYRW